jgi:ribosomal-protein-alanine N-acetyltransferase
LKPIRKNEWKWKLVEYEVRPIELGDVQEVFRIEVECFTQPWDSSDFTYIAECGGEVSQRFGKIRMQVVEYNTSIIAYIVWRLYFPDNIGHLLNIAVTEEHRRKGIARHLVSLMFSSLKQEGATSCFLEVRENNSIAQTFYKEMGMTSIHRRKGYYGDEDAIIFRIEF